MSEQQTIKDTLEVIRKALEDDTPNTDIKDYKNILILDKLVKEDGTINLINDKLISKEEIVEILNIKIDSTFEKHLNKWFDKNLPNYLEKYLKNKNN